MMCVQGFSLAEALVIKGKHDRGDELNVMRMNEMQCLATETACFCHVRLFQKILFRSWFFSEVKMMN